MAPRDRRLPAEPAPDQSAPGQPMTVNLGGKDFTLVKAEVFCRRYASGFYWISGSSLIGLIAMAAGMDVSPRLGVVQVTLELTAGEPGQKMMACAVGLAAVALLAFFGWRARRIERWPFMVGGWLFAADSLAVPVFLKYQDDLSLGFHGFWLLVLSAGGSAVRPIREARRVAVRAPEDSPDEAPMKKRPGVLRMIAVAALLSVLTLLPVYAAATGQSFLVTLSTRIFILALAATSLNLILGYGGMASFGHAAYLGIGGYAVAILAAQGITSGFVQWPLAIGASALFALAAGALSLRTRGIWFILITYAFGQIMFFAALHYRGPTVDLDDRMMIDTLSQFGGIIDLPDQFQFYYLCLALLAGAIFIVFRLVNSRFGVAMQGMRPDEWRADETSLPTFRARLAAFVIAGMMGGVAGALLVNQTGFVSPDAMDWKHSGALVVMVTFGGMGSLFGPSLGAATLVMLEAAGSQMTDYSPVITGLLLLFAVIHDFDQFKIVGRISSWQKYMKPMKTRLHRN